jgi:excisionase family DNA binding protein
MLVLTVLAGKCVESALFMNIHNTDSLKSILLRLTRVLEKIETHFSNGRVSGEGLLTKSQVAVLLGGKTSVRKVERLVKAGKLRSVPNLGKRTVRFRPADVERFVSRGEERPGRRKL